MKIKYVHTNIVSKDWRKLCDFYIYVFNCVELPPIRNLKGNWLSQGTGVEDAEIQGMHLQLPGYKVNGPTLEIFSYTKPEPAISLPKANHLGYGHLAFHVEDVAQCLSKLETMGGRRIGEITKKEFPNGLLTFVYACDPEGNIIEIQHWK